MATPAARPIQKRYTAGSCTLEVSFQPSALSQWHPKPIATDLAFKLWLQRVQQYSEQQYSEQQYSEQQYSEQTGPNLGESTVSNHGGGSPTLVAEGDRTQLQLITQHLQQQARQTLAKPALLAQSSLPVLPPQNPTQASTKHPAQFPPGCLIEGPLTYLQLCDLTSVLGQYEQAMQTLPVSLAVPLITQLPEQLPEQLPAASTATRPTSRDLQTPTSSKGRPPKTPKENLIPFPRARRRPSRKLWVSSAAAAIFAVGLTTTLLQTPKQFGSQSEITADSAGDSETLPQITAARPSEEAAPSNESNNVTTAQEKLSAANSSEPSSRTTGRSSDTGGSSTAGSSGTANRQRTATPPSNTAPSNTAADTSSPPSELPSPSAAATTPPNVAPEAIEAIPAPSPSSPTATPERSADTSGPIASTPRSAASPTTESLTLRRRTGSDLDSATSATTEETLTEAPLSSLPPQSPVDDEPASADAAGNVAADAPADAEISAGALPQQLPQQAAQSSPSPTARRPAIRQPSVETLTEGLTEEDADSAGDEMTLTLSAGERETIDKVTAYFQSQWQANRQLSGALTYRLQLSENGELVSFSAINDEAQAYRDRLIPSDRPLSFSLSEFSTQAPTSPLTLRITLMPNGQVLVSKF